ncbi:MAG: (2Fe-2S)-binding protein [Planctomycetes bacterium]|nr:(2Fe-2S)-binding protein [Planctomycetota bacterium]
MATLSFNGENKEVADGESIVHAAGELGVRFGCMSGRCGACAVEVKEGMDNLSPLSEEEEGFGVPEGQRLACQCDIQKGKVVISQE